MVVSVKKKPINKIPIISLIGHKNKVPNHVDISPRRKVPNHLGLPNLEDSHLSWRFSKADLAGPYKCHDLNHRDFQQLWERLKAFETKNLTEIRNTGSHPIPVPEYSKDAKDRLVEIGLDDLEELWSFRMDGTCRLICFREENIFAILWWDPHHKACPVEKSHT
jgi:hypothetical protein